MTETKSTRWSKLTQKKPVHSYFEEIRVVFRTVPVRFNMVNIDPKLPIIYIIGYIMKALAIATLIYGVTSWCYIKRFRNYRNYVCLNAIFANLLYISTLHSWNVYLHLFQDIANNYILGSKMCYILFCFLLTAKNHWLVNINHMFYNDIVKVFNGHFQRKYLKSSLFGWGVLLITTSVFGIVLILVPYSQHQWKIIKYVLFSFIIPPLLLNILLYIVTVYSLFRGSDASAPTAINKWRRLYIATLIFVLGDCGVLTFFTLKMWTKLRHFCIIFELLNLILLSVFLVVVKNNRELWYEFYVNIKQRLYLSKTQRHHVHDINMSERVSREQWRSVGGAEGAAKCRR